MPTGVGARPRRLASPRDAQPRCIDRTETTMHPSFLQGAHRGVLALLLLATLSAPALAHQTVRVGTETEPYDVVLGFTREPVVTEERNGLDLIVRTPDRTGVAGLAASLSATITSPDGRHTRPFVLRPQFGRPGAYTDDIVLTEPGVYTIRVWGFIGGIEFDVTFESHEVRPLGDLRFP
jgi:hypothetical protein